MANVLTGSSKAKWEADLSKAELELLNLIVEHAPISFEQIRIATGTTGTKVPRLVGMVGRLLRGNLIRKVPQTGKKVTHGDTFEPSTEGRKLVKTSLSKAVRKAPSGARAP